MLVEAGAGAGGLGKSTVLEAMVYGVPSGVDARLRCHCPAESDDG